MRELIPPHKRTVELTFEIFTQKQTHKKGLSEIWKYRIIIQKMIIKIDTMILFSTDSKRRILSGFVRSRSSIQRLQKRQKAL